MTRQGKGKRGVVARFLAGESVHDIAVAPITWGTPRVEAILRRALKKAGVTGKHEHVHITDEEGCVHDCKCGKRWGELARALRRKAKAKG